MGIGKLFVMKLLCEEFNFSYFLQGGALGQFSAVLKGNQGSDVLENFEVYIYSMVKETTFLKGNLCICKCFIDA